MDTKFFGVVIKVRNLELCRAFYRDVLSLGEPVMDSNFWVEFNIKDCCSLCLEKIEWVEGQDTVPQPAESNVSWLLLVNDLDEFVNRMTAYGYASDSKGLDEIGFAMHRFHDPEGNSFLVSARSTHTSEKEKMNTKG